MEICFYPGCSFETSAGYSQSLNALCAHLNIRLNSVPDWNCCGSTAFFSVQELSAYPAARVLALAAKSGAASLVTGCNGCYNTLRKVKKLLQENEQVYSDIQTRLEQEGLKPAPPDLGIRHLLEFFAQDVPGEAWIRDTGAPKLRVAAYSGCLLSRPWTDVDDPENPVMLDRFMQALGFTPVDHRLKASCCGAAHALPYREETEALVERIVRTMQDKGADLAATICPLCQLNLESAQLGLGLPGLPVLFFTQLAGLSLGLPHSGLGLDKLLISPEKLWS